VFLGTAPLRALLRRRSHGKLPPEQRYVSFRQ